MHQNKHKKHIPVLLDAVLQYLEPKEGDSYLDLTAGYGGHAEAVLDRTLNYQASVVVDRDQAAIDELRTCFSGHPELPIMHTDFLTATEQLRHEQRQFDLVLADLGLSSVHLDDASRGFSINQAAPLDMRMDQRQKLSATTIVNEYGVDDIVDILHRYGEEPKARRIAKLIVQNRPINDTAELARIVSKAWPGYSRVHPATRTFQALRIAVNDELAMLQKALTEWTELLASGGRIAVISFHSLEDRLVKHAFAERSHNVYEASLSLLTKRPVTASRDELVFNPRARSAKLRAAVKIKNRKEL